MKTSPASAVLAAALLLAPVCANAQELSGPQVVRTLDRLSAAAPAVDIAILAQEASASAGKGVAALPNWQALGKLSQLLVEIDFKNDSIAIEPDSYRIVGMIADALRHPNLRRYKFLVVGHTSSTGDARHNLDLSQKRADAITEALSTTFAVGPDRLFAIGVGQEWPLDPANPKAADNRRVQLVNLGLVK